jgi:Tfp pilus assembly protein PilN
MRAVNLLPKEIQRQSAQKPYGPIIIGTLAVAVCALVLVKMRADAQQAIKAKHAEIDLITKQKPKENPPYSEAQSLAFAQESPRITALDSALKTRVPWDNVLRQVSLVVPDDVYLTSLKLAAPVAADATTVVAATKPGVTILGYCYSQDGVARFLARLQVVPALTHVALTSSGFAAATTTGGSTDTVAAGVVTFEISADVVAPVVGG